MVRLWLVKGAGGSVRTSVDRRQSPVTPDLGVSYNKTFYCNHVGVFSYISKRFVVTVTRFYDTHHGEFVLVLPHISTHEIIKSMRRPMGSTCMVGSRRTRLKNSSRLSQSDSSQSSEARTSPSVPSEPS